MGTRPESETVGWLRDQLARYWEDQLARGEIVPLADHGGPAVSHSANHFVVPSAPEPLLIKISDARLKRSVPGFLRLKDRILEHCQRADLPVLRPLKTRAGESEVVVEDKVLEIIRFIPDAVTYTGSQEQDSSLLTAGLRLVDCLRRLPPDISLELVGMELPSMVEVEDLAGAAADAERLLADPALDLEPAYRRVAQGLRSVLAADSLARNVATVPLPTAVVHGDLHAYNLLFNRHRAGQLLAILDFDNIRVAAAAFDISWLADQIAWRRSSPGSDATDGVGRLIDAALEAGLLRREELPLLMPLLIAYAIPIVVDMAKDVLERGDDLEMWAPYFGILDIERKLRVHDFIQRRYRNPRGKPHIGGLKTWKSSKKR